MGAPIFSIVIPTRERADTLALALRTCLNQDFDDYEIIVSDNFSTPATREVVEATGSSKVKYIRSDRPLAMSENWELAVSHAAGEYVMVIGDDDGLMPYALRELDVLVRRHQRPLAVHWHRGTYIWPFAVASDQINLLRFPLVRFEKVVPGRDILKMVARHELTPGSLPMIYTSAIIHRNLIDKHRSIAGRLFVSRDPDIYSGYAFAYLCGTYVSVGPPMALNGLSPKSHGGSSVIRDPKNAAAEEFRRLSYQQGHKRHPLLPDVELTFSHMDDAFLFAKDTLFPDDPELVLDRKEMTVRSLATITETAPLARAEIRESIRNSLSDRPDLLEWFDTEAPDFPPARPFSHRPERFGFINNAELAVDASRFGIRDIVGAVEFATDILGFRTGEIPYERA